jgi:membrane-associated PAP2 superfamily phosphatase
MLSSAVRGCLPAAHPLTGYGWLGVGFVLYPTARNRARQAWCLAFAAGTACGFVQVARGAHFLSHVLWSAWLVSAVNVAILAACAARVHDLATTDSSGQRRPTSV